MRRWRTGLGTADVQDARGEIDLNPPSEGRPARNAAVTTKRRARLRTWHGGSREPDREGQLRSGRTSCRKDVPPSRFPTAAGKASCYCSSWRDLRRRTNAGIACWTKLEITPPSISNHSRYGTSTGSSPVTKTIGILPVAAFATGAAGV